MNHLRLIEARVHANELVENLTELLVLQRNGFDDRKVQAVENEVKASLRRVAEAMDPPVNHLHAVRAAGLREGSDYQMEAAS